MGATVGRRWKILIIVGLTIAVVDQWTKFLAVKHLTPGITRAHTGAVGSISQAEIDRVDAELGFFQELGYFYGSVKAPCRSPQSRCPSISVVDGFWNHRYVENPGAAWGLLANASDSLRVPFFILVSLGAIAFIIGFFRKLQESQLLLISSLSLVFGGAIGNFIDRLHLSYVIDFIDWYAGTAHWPTFNFADAAITSGVALLVIEWIRDSIRARAEKPAEKATSSPT
jgi:signal peptidase II